MYKLWDNFYWMLISYVLSRCGCDIKSVIAKDMLQINFMNSSCEIVLVWMQQNTFDRHLAITLTYVDPDLCCYLASSGHNELLINLTCWHGVE